MRYLMLGMMTESGQQLQGPDLEAWMAEIGAWYEKQGSTGKLADPGNQLAGPQTARTIRASDPSAPDTSPVTRTRSPTLNSASA